jgi:3'-phosphoadenosine 5'-phosphosulfate sulfotransferase (PAPS reductase)/FAD synthetase
MTTDLNIERLDGRRVVVSISGGKDSGALALHLRELGVEHDLVFLDTGWEHPLTYEYLRGDLARALGPITWLRPRRQMEELILSKGMFPSRVRRFCTEELKVFVMADYLKGRLEAGERLVNAVGIRHEESAARRNALEWETSGIFGCDVWAPLIQWTLDDVIAIHQRHGLTPNPLYLMGASRVGCWPCIYARKSEIRLIAEIDPDRIDRIRNLEAEVAGRARERYERDRAKWLVAPDPEPDEAAADAHERWEQKRRRLTNPFSPPAFFQGQKPSEDGHYRMLPIDEVVTWAKTSRGGKQFEMFAPTRADTGCMRWGLCEAIVPEPEPEA